MPNTPTEDSQVDGGRPAAGDPDAAPAASAPRASATETTETTETRTTETTESTGITSGTDRQSPTTEPRSGPAHGLPDDDHAVTQPIAPDGTPVPVDEDGHVLPPTDEQRDER